MKAVIAATIIVLGLTIVPVASAQAPIAETGQPTTSSVELQADSASAQLLQPAINPELVNVN